MAPRKARRKQAVARRGRGPARPDWLRRPSAAALGRWLNSGLLLCALALVLLLSQRAWEGLLSRPVGRIAVSGKLEHLQQDALRRVVTEGLDGGFVGADLDALRDRLEALPWVYRANVRRRWPDTLEIAVREQLPIARWGDRGFLNHEAELFSPRTAERWQGLPTIDGPAGSEQQLMDYYRRLRDLLEPLDLVISSLEQDERGQLLVRLDSGLALRLGDEAFQLRVQRFIDLYRKDLQERGGEVASVDMRYAQGAAVAFNEQPRLAAMDPEREP